MKDIDSLAKVARATWCGNQLLEGAVPPWESLAAQSKQVWIDVVEAVLKELPRDKIAINSDGSATTAPRVKFGFARSLSGVKFGLERWSE